MGQYHASLVLTLFLLLAQGCTESTKESDTTSALDAEIESTWHFQRTAGPITMNEEGRAVFANILVDGDALIATYQTAPPDTLNNDKHLFYRAYNRNLEEQGEADYAINVYEKVKVEGVEVLDFQGDLGDHKLLLIDDHIYFLSIVKGLDQAVMMKFDKDFNPVAGPLFVGEEDMTIEAHLDMGFCGDEHHLYAQFYYQNASDNPDAWGASIYQVNLDLELKTHAVVYPEEGTFVTGTACVLLKAGEMGVGKDRLQIFSTNKDYGNSERVGIHTFGADMKLAYISGSRKDIIEESLDVYFPVGPSFNAKHQIWVVGYTMENEEGEHGSKDTMELGPSYLQIFDSDWESLETIPVNDGDPAFRVMTQTEGDDIYVVYDEMDKSGSVTSSRARIEHYTISKP